MENKELAEELKQVEAFTRLTARAALMRQHLLGKNPFASASEELSAYLSSVGSERDLDSDDDKDADEVDADVEVVADQAMDPPPP